MEKSDLKKNEIYHYVYDKTDEYIARFDSKNAYIFLKDKRFNKIGSLNWFGDDIKPATPEEKHWLLECEKANKFISKEEAMKSFNVDYVGRYIKALIDYPRSGTVRKGNIGIIKANGFVDFPFQKNYAWSFNANEEGIEYELMPIDYNPENKPTELTSLPDKWCVKNVNKCLENKINKIGVKSIFKGNALDSYYYINTNNVINTHYEVPIGYTEITFDQFKKWVLKDSSKPDFIVGKWYRDISTAYPLYIKFKKYSKEIYYHIYSSERIGSNGYEVVDNDYWTTNGRDFKEISLEEIQQYLPDRHVDKISKTPNMQALLEEAKRRYPVGTKIKRITEDREVIINGVPKIYDNGINVTVKNSNNAWLFYNCKWAEIVSEVAPKQEYPLYVECIASVNGNQNPKVGEIIKANEEGNLLGICMYKSHTYNNCFRPSTKEAYLEMLEKEINVLLCL